MRHYQTPRSKPSKIAVAKVNVKARLDRRQFGEDGHLKLETPEKISGILRSHELYLPTKRFKIGKYDQFRIVANFPVDNATEWKDISKYLPDQVADIFPLE